MSHQIRTTEVHAGEGSTDCVARIYAQDLDAVIVKGVIGADVIDHLQTRFRQDDPADGWARPNKPMPPIDLRLLGVGAAPTATTPNGPEAETYFAAVADTCTDAADLLATQALPELIESGLKQVSSLPVSLADSSDGRSFGPYTVRSMNDGVGLMLHHDLHYRLPVYDTLRNRLDTSLQLSYFIVLQRPESGGRICLYGCGPENDAELPKLDNGMLDVAAINEVVPHQHLDPAPGDMLVFGSGRIYHSVEPVVGPIPRVTIGGFLALDQRRESCIYWG